MIRILLILVFFTTALKAEPNPSSDLYVHPTKGDDGNDGRTGPAKTIARAVALAQPGDTIHLEPGTYRESIDLSNKNGAPGKPITLDGHGAVIDGSESVAEPKWKKVLPGLYRGDFLYKVTTASIIDSWFLVWDGKMNRMERCSKGISEPLPSATELGKGDWTYSKVYNAFFLQLDEKMTAKDVTIRYPARANGVTLSGSGSWLTIKNLTCTHVYDDGFNVSGVQQNIIFENISAIECGEDGFNASGQTECQVNNFVSIGNDTGIYDNELSQTHYKNVLIKECLSHDLYFMGKEHSLENGFIESEAQKTLVVSGKHLKRGEVCHLKLKNIKLKRVEVLPQELHIGESSLFQAERCGFAGLDVTVERSGSTDIQHCLFQRGEESLRKPKITVHIDAIWRGEGNRYDISTIKIGSGTFDGETFSKFQEITKSDATSVWGDLKSQTKAPENSTAMKTGNN